MRALKLWAVLTFSLLFAATGAHNLLVAAPVQKVKETAEGKDNKTPQLRRPSKEADGRVSQRIAEQVRHELLLMPYYGVFDWIEASVMPGDVVTLRGQVTRDTTKSDAGYRVGKLESVAKVVNQIEVLPLSPSDDRIRFALYRAIFNYNGSLFRYATHPTPPIRILVKNGRVTLKGFVASEMDKQLAYFAARNVPGTFEVRNELMVDRAKS